MIIWNNWNGVFSHSLGQAERTRISEIRDVRNKWAHQETFNNEDAHRALDTMQRLLKACSPNQASDIHRLKNEVLQLLVKEKEKPVRRPPNDERPVRGTESYHVYVNTRRPPGVAMIRLSQCVYADDDHGIQGKPPNRKSYWSPSLGSYDKAKTFSQRASPNIKIRPCKHCNPR